MLMGGFHVQLHLCSREQPMATFDEGATSRDIDDGDTLAGLDAGGDDAVLFERGPPLTSTSFTVCVRYN